MGEGGKRTRNAVKSAHKEADDAETKLREVRKLHALAHFSLYLSFYFFFFLCLAPFVVSLSSFTLSTLTLYAIRFPLLFILTLSSLSFFLLLQEAFWQLLGGRAKVSGASTGGDDGDAEKAWHRYRKLLKVSLREDYKEEASRT